MPSGRRLGPELGTLGQNPIVPLYNRPRVSAAATLGRFELLRALGRGASGEVFLARDPLLERIVALKTIRLDVLSSSDAEGTRRRFLREAQITARLSHPHIVAVHEFGEASGNLFLAMEYVSGGTLAQRLVQDGPYPLAERVLILAEVAEALAYAHAQGVVHRDLKPANVLLSAPDFAKVSDFGIGKLVGMESDLTGTGEMVGSPAYMSPEQMRGESLDAKSDLFSFGILAFQTLTGRKPFPADTLTALVRQVQEEEPVDPRVFDADIPTPLAALTLRCLAKASGDRPHDADEIARALHEQLGEMAGAPRASGARARAAFASQAPPSSPAAEATTTSPLPRAVEAHEEPRARGRTGSRMRVLLASAFIGASAVALFMLLARGARPRPAGPLLGGGRPVPAIASATPLVPAVPPAAAPSPLPSPSPLPPTRTPSPAPTPRPRPTATPVPTATPLPLDSTLVRLDARSGLRLKIDPPQARVFVDDVYAGIADDWDGAGGGALLTFAEPGHHRVRVAYIGRGDLLVDLLVSATAPNDVVELKQPLRRGNPGGPTGPSGKIGHPDYRTHDGIRFAIRNPDAEVTVDGRKEGLASEFREKELRLRSPAVHEVTIRSGTRKAEVRILAAPSVAETATVDETLR